MFCIEDSSTVSLYNFVIDGVKNSVGAQWYPQKSSFFGRLREVEASSLGGIFPASFSRAVANSSEIRGSGVERGVGRCVINRRDSGQGHHQGCDYRGNFKPVIVSRYYIKNRQKARFVDDS